MRTNILRKNQSSFVVKTLFLLLLAAVFLIPLLFSSPVEANVVQTDPAVVEALGEYFAINYAQAKPLVHQMRDMWNSNALSEMGLNRAEQQQFIGENFLPDYIGGIYYDENGRFVILVVESEQDNAVSLQSRSRTLEQSDVVVIKIVQYSHNEIRQAQEYIFDTLDNCVDRSSLSNFDRVGGGPDVINNRLDIQLFCLGSDELNLANVRLFRQYVFDAPFLVFHFPDPNIEHTILHPLHK